MHTHKENKTKQNKKKQNKQTKIPSAVKMSVTLNILYKVRPVN